MGYNHDIFQRAWQTVPASYPALLGKHEKVTDLVHLYHKKQGRGKSNDTRKLKVIDECLEELGIHQHKDAFRVFAATYLGILGQIILHGRHRRAQQSGPRQARLAL